MIQSGKKSELVALLAGLSLFLATLEFMIPKPLPFMKIGLVNIVLILSLTFLSNKEYFFLVLIKIFSQGLLHGTLFSYVFIFSLIGTLGSSIIMFIMYKTLYNKRISLIGISLSGALISTLLQLVLSRYFIFGESIIYMIPIVLMWGVFSGITVGILSSIILKKSKWLKVLIYWDGSEVKTSESIEKEKNSNNNRLKSIPVLLKVIYCAISITIIIVFANYYIKAIILFILVILNILSGKKIRIFFYLSTAFLILVFHQLKPTGLVLFEYNILKITEISLFNGLNRVFILFSMILSSQFIVASGIKIPGKFGCLVVKSLEIFDILASQKSKVRPKKILEDIDNVLFELYNPIEDNQLQK